MFFTNNHAKVNSLIAESDENIWAYLELINHNFWFFVDCLITEGTEKFITNYLFIFPNQLKELYKDDSAEIISVYLVSPPNVNKSGRWQMDKIAYIRKGFRLFKDLSNHVYVYELVDGKKYYSDSIEEEIIDEENIEILYEQLVLSS